MTKSSDPDGVQLPINIQSVADFSGIPRETVRREVNALHDRGMGHSGRGRAPGSMGAITTRAITPVLFADTV